MTQERIFLLSILVIVSYILLPCKIAATTQTESVTITMQDDLETVRKKITQWCPATITLESVQFAADFYVSSSELRYLLGFKKGVIVDADALVTFCLLLHKKEKIETITLSYNQGELTVTLQGYWTFNKLKIGGFFGYKDPYYSYYALQPGEPFDKQKHEHSLQKLQELFQRDGYHNARITDTISYDKQTKSVTVQLNLDRGTRFSIGSIDFIVQATGDMHAYDVKQLKKKLERIFGKQLIKSNYSQELLNKEGDLLRKYLLKKGFLNARISLQEETDHQSRHINLIFTIDLHPKKSFVFFGNQFFTNAALLEQVLLFGRLSWFLSPSILSDEIAQAYREKGFLEIAVKPRQEGDYYFFLINEGRRAVIKDIVFKGITYQNHRFIRKKFFQQFKYNAFFDAEALKKSLTALSAYYHKEGFWDFSVLKHELVPLAEGAYRLIIRVDEGQQRFLSNITVDHDPKVLYKAPFAQLLKNGKIPFDVTLLQAQRAWLMDYYQHQGYHAVQIKPELDQTNPTAVSVIWHISNVDKKVLFGKPIIVDSHKFSHKRIMRELQFKEGDVWSKEAVDASLMRLKRLGIFQSIRLYPISWSDNFGQYQPINIKVQEDDPFELRVRAGVQQVSENLTFRSGTTYKVGASLLYKNPFDFGDYIRADTDFTLFYRNVSLAYFRPWLFNVPVSTLFKAYTNKYNQPVIRGSKTTLYRVGQEGFLIELSRYYNHVNTGTLLGLEFIETNRLTPEQAAAINFDQDLVDRNIPYIFCEPTVMVDYLDDKINPHMGTFTVLSLKTMIPWKKDAVPFFKILAQQSFYVPLARFFILAWRIRFGHIFNQEFRNIMPIERFYLGGENSLRSYEPDLAPPLGLLVEDDGKERLVPQGGRSMLNGNLEFRFTLYGNLMFVLFQDVGALIEKEFAEIKGGRLLAATGFGFRYFTPIGPLRFDMGFKWHRDDPKESTLAWFLTLGHAFF